jgi:hypothetical protein
MVMGMRCLFSVGVLLGADFHRHQHKSPMAHASFCNYVFSKVANIFGWTTEDYHLQTTGMIQMEVSGTQRNIMMLVLSVNQSFGQFAHFMIVDINERADTVATVACLLKRLLHACASEIANRFGAVLISASGHKPVQVGDKVVVEGYSHTLHRQTP